MNKCPQCLNVLSKRAEVCEKCGFSIKDDVTKTLTAFGLDKTQATRILSDEKMTSEKWQKIKALFEAVQEVSPEKRQKFLVNACGDDKELKAEVEKLLGSSDESEDFLESPAVAEAVSLFEEKKTLAIQHTTGEINNGDFVAGTVLDERYRIIGLLGKGGMGEVYKAEDLKLGQMVALKFLPEKLERNEDALRRFIGEVRTARQVSHANVCKVFDIGDVNGKHFLSMEFIEGDDLSQLLNRVGRLPSERAAEVSRQICFGLHAIHEAGILHRDLKPANIIIDSKGKARITDFGIAGIEEEINSEEIRVGTPAYMSPEQITGKEVTPKSDIYSLGLLLYEIYTGNQAINADSFEELLEKQKTTQPTNPSKFVENIEPIVEKTINRCLEKSPEDRPKSALQVALALPGGNPLEAAIAAGETPSPEMVAAAPKKGVLKPLVALGILLAFIAVHFTTNFLNQGYKTYNLTPLEKSPEVLAEKSREIISKFGYNESPVDVDYQFAEDDSFFDYHGYRSFERKPGLPGRKELLGTGRPFHLYFLYRQSPRYLAPIDDVVVAENEPPMDVAGMINVKLDPLGRLFEFIVIPPQTDSAKSESKTDWKEFFEEAGLDFEKFEKAESEWTPPVFADERNAWKGTLPEISEVPIRVETAQYQGKPVYFKVVKPWDLPTRETAANQNNFIQYGVILIIVFVCVAIIGSFIFAYRNLRAGRGDLQGGIKLTLFLFGIGFFSQMLQADHVPTIWGELSVLFEAASYAMIRAILVGLLYFALEPFVRRYWSELLISWSRVMKGDFRDPLVGRDVLIGGLLGITHGLGIHIGTTVVKNYLGNFDSIGTDFTLSVLNGTSDLISSITHDFVGAILISLIELFLAYLFYRLTGRKFLGVFLVGLISFSITFLFFAINVHPLLSISGIIINICLIVALYKFGLLGLISFNYFFIFVWVVPITFDNSQFYFSTSMLGILIPLVIILYAFYNSIGGKSAFSGNVFKETGD